MGKKIDRAALHVLAALALYLFFAAAFRNIWAAAACALCAMLCLRRVLSGLTGRLPQREKRRERARAEVERWALLDAATAEKEARALLEKAYPGQLEGAEMAGLGCLPSLVRQRSLCFWRSEIQRGPPFQTSPRCLATQRIDRGLRHSDCLLLLACNGC